MRRAVDTAVETGSDYIVEFRFRHANGEWRWMEGRGRAVYADDGNAADLVRHRHRCDRAETGGDGLTGGKRSR